MEKIIENKVARLLELTEKFTKSFNDLYPTEGLSRDIGFGYNTVGYSTTGLVNMNQSNSISMSGKLLLNGSEIYVDGSGIVKSRDNKPLSRADEIRAIAEIKAKISDELDEYNKLRNDLSDYFRALKNITE